MKINVRRLLFVLLASSLIVHAEDIRSFTILHTNDLHAHLMPDENGLGGFAYIAAEVKHQREGCAACIYLDGGDLVQGSPASSIFHGTPVYELANLLGIEGDTLGNHEFDYGWRMIQRFARIAHFPVANANVRNATGHYLTGKPYFFVKLAGLRIAVIGAVMGDLLGNFSTAEQVGPWRVEPVVETLRRVIPEVRPQSDLIMVLGHLNEAETEAILRELPEIPLVIAGHLEAGYYKQVGHRYGVNAKIYGVELGRLDVRYDVEKHDIASAKWTRIPIDSHQITPDPVVARAVAKWEARVDKVVGEPLGEARRTLSRAELQPFVEKAMAEATGADIGFITVNNIRATLPQGRVLARNIWELLPFDNLIVTGTFKGRELPPAITSRYPVEPEKVYKVAVTDFLATNQASPTQLNASGLKFPQTGPLQRDAMINWIRKKKVLE